MSDQLTLIRLTDVAKVYGADGANPLRAIDRVTANIKEGEFISILGPSGCGKSTLLMMIAGLLPHSEGEIMFDGRDVTGPQDDFGIVFQSAVLFPWRSVAENVALPGEIKGIPADKRMASAQKMIDLVGLHGFEDRLPKQLSGGMQQRVAIARALSLDPKLLLMDEPFGALDAMTRDTMNEELQRIRLELGATVIFVTHSISEAVFLSDRVFVMSGRPSRLSEIVEIDLPRPREIAIANTDRFGEYSKHLRALLESGEEN